MVKMEGHSLRPAVSSTPRLLGDTRKLSDDRMAVNVIKRFARRRQNKQSATRRQHVEGRKASASHYSSSSSVFSGKVYVGLSYPWR